MSTATAMKPTSDSTRPSVHFTDLLRSEWTKLFSVRSTPWSLAVMAVLSVGVTVLATAMFAHGWNTMDAELTDRARHDAIGLFLQPGITYGRIAVCVLGVMVIASEYSTGMIRSSVLASPSRTPVLLSKAVVLSAVLVPLGLVMAFASWGLGTAILGDHVSAPLGDATTLRALFGLGFYLALLAVFSLAVGALLRHVGGAITVMVTIVMVLPVLTELLPGETGEKLAAYLPSEAADSLLSTGYGVDHTPSAALGMAVMLAWTLGALAVAAYSLRRRDV